VSVSWTERGPVRPGRIGAVHWVTRDRFEELVGEALDQLPAEIIAMLDNVVITVEESSPDGADLLGLYHGIALTERDTQYSFAVPDTVVLYRGPLMRISADEDELAEEIAVTIVHELGHHLGIDDARLHELGWG
jgi:predicted Zn-dependent protease with MMP-like domain